MIDTRIVVGRVEDYGMRCGYKLKTLVATAIMIHRPTKDESIPVGKMAAFRKFLSFQT